MDSKEHFIARKEMLMQELQISALDAADRLMKGVQKQDRKAVMAVLKSVENMTCKALENLDKITELIKSLR